MATDTSNAKDVRAIRKLMDDSAKALREKDIARLMANYAPVVLSFDVINPLRYSGSDAVRERLEAWTSSFQGPIGYETRDLDITAGDDVAFCHSLNHVSATTKDGTALDMWWRATVGFRKIDGRWMVTHAHSSVPFDVESGKASLELTP